MWHFGADATTIYTREKFYASWEVGQHALITVYSKDWKDGKSRVRIEKQEYSQKSLAEALEEKLYSVRWKQMLELEIDRLKEIDGSLKNQLKKAGFNSIKDIVIRGL
jgi:hypothetical protein